LFERLYRESQLTATTLNPASASSWGLAWGTAPAVSGLERRGRHTDAMAAPNPAMLDGELACGTTPSVFTF